LICFWLRAGMTVETGARRFLERISRRTNLRRFRVGSLHQGNPKIRAFAAGPGQSSQSSSKAPEHGSGAQRWMPPEHLWEQYWEMLQSLSRSRQQVQTIVTATVAFLLSILGYVLLNWKGVKSQAAQETAELVSTTIKDESLQTTAGELSKVLINDLLTDEKVGTQCKEWVWKLLQSLTPQITELFVHILSTEAVLTQVKKLLDDLVVYLCESEQIQTQVASLLLKAIWLPSSVESTASWASDLINTPAVIDGASRLSADVVVSQPVYDKACELSLGIVADVLKDSATQELLLKAIKQLLSDPELKAQASDTIWGIAKGAVIGVKAPSQKKRDVGGPRALSRLSSGSTLDDLTSTELQDLRQWLSSGIAVEIAPEAAAQDERFAQLESRLAAAEAEGKRREAQRAAQAARIRQLEVALAAAGETTPPTQDGEAADVVRQPEAVTDDAPPPSEQPRAPGPVESEPEAEPQDPVEGPPEPVTTGKVAQKIVEALPLPEVPREEEAFKWGSLQPSTWGKSTAGAQVQNFSADKSAGPGSAFRRIGWKASEEEEDSKPPSDSAAPSAPPVSAEAQSDGGQEAPPAQDAAGLASDATAGEVAPDATDTDVTPGHEQEVGGDPVPEGGVPPREGEDGEQQDRALSETPSMGARLWGWIPYFGRSS